MLRTGVLRLIAVVNTKLPEVGDLLLKRVIFSFRRAYKRRDKVSYSTIPIHMEGYCSAHSI